MTIGPVYNDGRAPRPWVFTIRAGARVDHLRFHERDQAERDRAAAVSNRA